MFYILGIVLVFTSFPCRSLQSRLRRPVGAGEVVYAYTPANEAADGLTWRDPYGASARNA